MTDLQRKTAEPIMGRADILLRFLQLIGKDRPQDLEPYLVDLDTDTELRPVADQIVDRIIAGDKQLYESYSRARREVGARNPYWSASETELDIKRERALGYFLSRWVALETQLRRAAEREHEGKPYYALLMKDLYRKLETMTPIDGRDIERLRSLRNQAVHGIDPPSEEQLIEASKMIEVLIDRLNETRKAAIEALVTFRENGVHYLLNRTVNDDNSLAQLKRDVQSWEEEVLRHLAEVASPSDITNFRVLSTFSPKHLTGWNAEHAQLRDILAEKLDRLLAIIRGLETSIS